MAFSQIQEFLGILTVPAFPVSIEKKLQLYHYINSLKTSKMPQLEDVVGFVGCTLEPPDFLPLVFMILQQLLLIIQLRPSGFMHLKLLSPHPVLFSNDDWGVQSPQKSIVLGFHHSEDVSQDP